MRHLLVDYARRHNAGKRGSGDALLTYEQDRLEELACESRALAHEVRAPLSAQGQETLALSAPVEQLRDDYWRSVSADDPDAAEDLCGRRFGPSRCF